MLMMAMRLGFKHCVDRKEDADIDSSLVVKEPGTMRMSNCGAFSNEFYHIISHDSRCASGVIEKRGPNPAVIRVTM